MGMRDDDDARAEMERIFPGTTKPLDADAKSPDQS